MKKGKWSMSENCVRVRKKQFGQKNFDETKKYFCAHQKFNLLQLWPLRNIFFSFLWNQFSRETEIVFNFVFTFERKKVQSYNRYFVLKDLICLKVLDGELLQLGSKNSIIMILIKEFDTNLLFKTNFLLYDCLQMSCSSQNVLS